MISGSPVSAMQTVDPFDLVRPAPVVVGTGLVALDVVHRASSPGTEAWTGGTCGNVLVALSYLGWRSFPVTRLNGDAAAALIRSDLQKWRVRLDYTGLSPVPHAPIVFHEIRNSGNGTPCHRFSLKCPKCGGWLPTYRPVTIRAARQVNTVMATPSVFFMDRVSPGALSLAEECERRGALIVFEPSAGAPQRHIERALALCHVLKYSVENRGLVLGKCPSRHQPLLEIETRGAEGLRFRTGLSSSRNNVGWQWMKAHSVQRLRDTAGAGDWCTAGVIHSIGQAAAIGAWGLNQSELRQALSFGQSLAAWSCGYDGARGGMYAVTPDQFRREVRTIASDSCDELKANQDSERFGSNGIQERFAALCRKCDAAANGTETRILESR